MAELPAPEELWEEILLRLPPDDPASLLRASLVSKQWRRIVTCRGFLRRLAELHRAPPMLGFFEGGSFVPTTACPAFSLPVPENRCWRHFIDCRHGRALLLLGDDDLLVWEPITGYHRRVPLPAAIHSVCFNAAVACAEDGCDHWCCHGRAFRVVLIWARDDEDGLGVFAWEYSSEAGAWGEALPVPARPDPEWGFDFSGSILLGNSLYFLCGTWEIIKYDLGGQGLVSVIKHAASVVTYSWSSGLIHAEDGGLGVAKVDYSRHLCLWSRKMSAESDGEDKVYTQTIEVDSNSYANAGWVLRRTIHLKNLLPAAALSGARPKAKVIGFAEGANVIFLDTNDGIFTIELKSGRVRKVRGSRDTLLSHLHPFISFYAPGWRLDDEEQGGREVNQGQEAEGLEGPQQAQECSQRLLYLHGGVP